MVGGCRRRQSYRAPSATSSPSPSHLHLLPTSARRSAKCDATPRGARPRGQASPSPPARSSASSGLAPSLACARETSLCQREADVTSPPHLPAPSSFSDPDATLRLHYSASRPGPAVHVTPRLLPFASRRPPLVLFPTSCGIWPRTYSAPSRFPVSVFFILRAGRVEWGGRCSRIKEKGWTKKTVLSLCGRRFARRSLAEAV